ncbi:MAG: PQQ-binding-like beta-propeller repeat protein, partial [Candidatus Firestonebacteria bacterium]
MHKTISKLIAAVFCLTALFSAADYKYFKRDIKRSGTVTEQAYPGLTQKLAKQLAKASLTSPIVYKGLVFLGDSSGKISAFDASGDNPEPVWQYSAGGKIISSLAADNGIVYALSQDGKLYALKYLTGELLYNYTIGSSDVSSPLIYGGCLYGATGFPNKILYSFNLATRTMSWTKDVGTYVYSSPAFHDGYIYSGANNGRFYALDAANGDIKWYFQTLGDFLYSSPCVSSDGNWVYFAPGNDDRKIYALNAKTGAPKSGWVAVNFGTTPTVASSITEEDGVLYFVSGAAPATLYAVNTADGTQKWARPLDNPSAIGMLSSPVAVNGVIYVGSAANKLYAVKASDGTIINSYNTSVPVLSSPAAANGKVYVCAGENGDGYFYIYQASKVSALTYPEEGSMVSGEVAVKGVLVNSGLTSYKLEYSFGSTNTWVTINEAAIIPGDGVVGNFITPGLAEGTYTLRLTVADGTSLNSRAILTVILNNALLNITRVSPTAVFNNTGASTLTITGTGFTGGVEGGASIVTSVAVNGTSLTLPGSGITNTTIPGLMMPAGIASGTYDIIVNTTGGSATGSKMITVVTSAPAITSITPSGRFNNTAVRTLTVNGNGFTGGVSGGTSTVTAVSVNGAALTLPVSGITNTTIPGLLLPSGMTIGTYNIIVAAQGGTGTGT